MALLKNKPVYTKDFLQGKMARPCGKVRGWPWEEVLEKNESNLKHRIFGDNKFVFSAAAESGDLETVCRLMGGTVLKRVPRVGQASVVVTPSDREFYNKHCKSKHLQFYGVGLLEESALLAEPVWEKHRVDELFFS